MRRVAAKLRHATHSKSGSRSPSRETAAAIERIRLEGDHAAARAVLNALIARSDDAPVAEPRHLRPVPTAELSVGALVERARSGSPALASNGAEINAARSRSTLADKGWYPDLTIGAGPLIQTNNRSPGVAATIGFTVPLPWGREASEQQAATAQLGAARHRYDAAMLDIQSALGEAVARLKAARRAEALLSGEAIPTARAALKALAVGYSQGRGDLATALDAQHRVHDLELKLLQTQLDQQVSLAAIERLIGGEL